MITTDPIGALAPQTAADAVGSAGPTLGQDEFLQMLIAQLENQDPLNPQDATEFTAQLAQFSSLEQLISIQDGIQGLTESQTRSQRLGAAGLIGRDVVAEASQIPVTADGPLVQPSFVLAGNASDTTVTLLDPNGVSVGSLDLGALAQGEHAFQWDGTDAAGNAVAPGVYSFVVRALAGDESVEVLPRIQGRVTGAVPSGTDPLLLVGDLAIPLSQVEEVTDATAASAQSGRPPEVAP